MNMNESHGRGANPRNDRALRAAGRTPGRLITTDWGRYDETGRRRYRSKLATVRAEAHEFIRRFGRRSMRGERDISNKSKRDRRITLLHFVDILHEKGYCLEHLHNFSEKHIEVLIADMLAKGQKNATIATKCSILRWLCVNLGKRQLVSCMDSYFPDPSVRRRSQKATIDKSLEGAGITFEELYERAKAECPYVAEQLRLCYRFGMRVQESWMWRPFENVTPQGVLLLHKGAKGGRPRVYPYHLTEDDWAVIERCRALVKLPHRSMIPIEFKPEKWRRRFYTICERIGFTKAVLGATSHGLRHSRAHRLTKEITGQPPPVCGGERQPVDPNVERLARLRVAEMLGHAREAIASHYIG